MYVQPQSRYCTGYIYLAAIGLWVELDVVGVSVRLSVSGARCGLHSRGILFCLRDQKLQEKATPFKNGITSTLGWLQLYLRT